MEKEQGNHPQLPGTLFPAAFSCASGSFAIAMVMLCAHFFLFKFSILTYYSLLLHVLIVLTATYYSIK